MANNVLDAVARHIGAGVDTARSGAPLAPTPGGEWRQGPRVSPAATGYAAYGDLVADLEARGHTPVVLGTAADGSPVVAVRSGGTKQPPIFLSAGAHSTEQAGVCAAVDLLDELVTEHELWVLPCRDPIGLTGFRHALRLGMPGQSVPTLETVGDAAALLRSHGTVLVDDPDNGGLLVALMGEYGYALYDDGRASSMLPVKFSADYQDAAAALAGRRIWWCAPHGHAPTPPHPFMIIACAAQAVQLR